MRNQLMNALFWVPLGIFLWTCWILTQVCNGWYYIRHPEAVVPDFCKRAGRSPLPLPRSRQSLTRVDATTSYYSQSQSPLFQLVPELRQVIYQDIVVAPSALHVRRAHRRLCSTPCEGGHHDHCRQPLAQDGTVLRRLPSERPRWDKFLPLLRSCRRVYSEAIHLLYESNTFIFDDLQAIRSLPRCITPCRLSSIRRLHIDIDAFENRSVSPKILSAWKPTCDILSGMQGLIKLTITLRSHDTTETQKKLALSSILDPLKSVKVSKFVVQVPPNGDPENVVDGTDDVSFVLVPKAGLFSRHYRCEWWDFPKSRLLPPPYWPDS
ncbi:hypothetical protein BDW59DRAFT_166856 [Aspergillus cavernicola]|uniref:DUF7730 domain-containing protein n=1 Tax=Aspergillus cavernicola TaxID=176166 RepID=A0ABR4HIV3_9EURO